MESYFLSNFSLDDNPAGNDPDEKPSGEKRLVNAFKQPVSKLYSMFVQSVISVFDSFNTFLQAEEPLIHILYYSTLRLYSSLLSRFILPGSYPIIRWFAKYWSFGAWCLERFLRIFMGTMTKQYARDSDIIRASD